jgi:hypothetical protein
MRLTCRLGGLRFVKDSASHIKGEYSMKYSLVVVFVRFMRDYFGPRCTGSRCGP